MAFRRASAALIAVAGLTSAIASSCVSTVLNEYTFPETELSTLNPWLRRDADYKALVTAGCSPCRDDGEVCHNLPALGSGLALIAPGKFVGLTDRGPNQDCEDLADLDPVKYSDAVGKAGKGFPTKGFAPTMTHFSVGADGELVVEKSVPLKLHYGKPISGLPNTDADDTPYAANCKGEPLAKDPNGLDTEDLALIPGTDYVAIVDEYSPSIAIANVHTGVLSSRNVPASVAPQLSGAGMTVVGDIPDVFTNRRKNRGFEAVVVDADAKYALAIVQSPMLGPENYDQNTIIRVAHFEIVMGANGVPTLKYTMQFAIEASPVAAYANTANKPKDMKYSGAVYTAPNEFVVLERAKGQVKLFTVNWAGATNLDTTAFASTLDLEKASHNGQAASQVSVTSARKTLIWDSLKDVPAGTDNFTGASKQEGFVIDPVDPTIMWMVADNDFGLEGNGPIVLRKIKLGRSISGSTICDKPAHPPAPTISTTPTKTISLVNSQTYRISDEPGAGAAENFDVDETARVAYVANDDTGAIDKYDLSAGPCNDDEAPTCTFPDPPAGPLTPAPDCPVSTTSAPTSTTAHVYGHPHPTVAPPAKCTPVGKRCAGAPGKPYVPWLGCCHGSCETDPSMGWGRFCKDSSDPPPGPSTCTKTPPGERCAGAPGKPHVPWLGGCCFGTCAPDSSKGWGSWCPSVDGPSPKCSAPGTRCAGAPGKPYVEWLGGCCSGECALDESKGWGKWCPEVPYQAVRQATCTSTASAPVAPMTSFTLSADFKPTSTSVCKKDGRVAAAFADDNDGPGRIAVLTADLALDVEVVPDVSCFLPDHVQWADDCSYLTVACEGEGSTVPGGVMVADFVGGSLRSATVAGFAGYDSMVADVKAQGIRLVESEVPSVDWEPEYITIVGQFAYVTLQEANAIAVVDLPEATISEIKPIGFIDRSKPGFGLDASNKDDGIFIKNYDYLFGMPQPDTIKDYVAADGMNYLIFANEGDAKDDFEARGADICDPDELNRTCSADLAALANDDTALGRIKVTTVDGYNADTNTQEALYSYGGRSFSIMALDGTVVFDSGEWIGRIQEAMFPEIFNSNGFDDEDLGESQADLMDNRSDDKGGEVESLDVLTKGCTTYAFVGLERSSIIMVFDITVPRAPIFVDAVQNHPFNDPTDEVFAEGRQGDLDPEGLFASLRLGRLFVSGSVSNTVSSYDIQGL